MRSLRRTECLKLLLQLVEFLIEHTLLSFKVFNDSVEILVVPWRNRSNSASLTIIFLVIPSSRHLKRHVVLVCPGTIILCVGLLMERLPSVLCNLRSRCGCRLKRRLFERVDVMVHIGLLQASESLPCFFVDDPRLLLFFQGRDGRFYRRHVSDHEIWLGYLLHFNDPSHVSLPHGWFLIDLSRIIYIWLIVRQSLIRMPPLLLWRRYLILSLFSVRQWSFSLLILHIRWPVPHNRIFQMGHPKLNVV